MKLKSNEFQKGLVSAVYGIKSYINSVREDFKTIKMKPNNTSLKANILKKKGEIEGLME